MKSLLRVSPILALCFLTACQAKDTFIPKAGGSANTLGGQASNSQFESNKHMMLLLDRQVEVIHLFKALIDNNYAEKKGLKVEDAIVNKVNLKKITSQIQNFKDGPREQTSNINLIVSVELDTDQSIRSAQFRSNSEAGTEEKIVVSGTDVTLKNKFKEMTITKTADATAFEATLRTIDEVNVTAGNFVTLNESKFKFSINGNEAKILSVQLAQHNRYGLQAGDMSMKTADDSSVLDIKLDDACTSVMGVLKLESLAKNAKKLPAYTRTATYTDSSVSFLAGRNTLNVAANFCESRPVVDLKKLF